MQNTIPIDIAMPQAQPTQANTGTSNGKSQGTSFSETMGNTVEQTNKQPGQTTKDKSMKAAGEKKDRLQDDVEVIEEVDVTQAATPPVVDMIDIQYTIADLLIGITNENESMYDIGLKQELPMNEQTVDVLEGLQLMDNEAGIDNVSVTRNEAQPTQENGDAEAWMPTDSSPYPPEGAQPVQMVDVEREIEARLQEHLSPLDNLNGSLETEISETNNTKDLDVDIDFDIQLKPADNGQEAAGAEQLYGFADDGEGQTEDEPQAKTDQPKTEIFTHQSSIGTVQTEAQPVTQPKVEQAEESFFNRMVEDITTNAQQGKREFSINLRPDFMGDMNIELVMTEAGLSAKIRTANNEISSMISQHLFKLEQSLKEQGIDVASLEVSVFDTGDFTKGDFNSDNRAFSSNADGGKQQRLGRISASVSDSAMIMETLTESQVLQPIGLGSSVEYTA